MPDKLDQAKDVEMLQRDQSLKQALSIKDPAQRIVANQVFCIDCDTEIGAARLAAKPKAARCIDCQQLWEQS